MFVPYYILKGFLPLLQHAEYKVITAWKHSVALTMNNATAALWKLYYSLLKTTFAKCCCEAGNFTCLNIHNNTHLIIVAAIWESTGNKNIIRWAKWTKLHSNILFYLTGTTSWRLNMPLIHTEFKQNNTIQSSFHINTISAMMHFIYIIFMSVYTEQIMQDISTLTHHIYFTIFNVHKHEQCTENY